MRILKTLSLLVLAAALLPAKTVKITVLATTDLHGNLFPYDYFTAQPAARGLAKISTLVEEARKQNPNSLLIDCGDSIQGSTLEGVYQYSVRNGRLPLGIQQAKPLEGDPVMRAMNLIGYDAMVLGNHEFNYGLGNLDSARRTAKFPWLSANTVASGKARGFEPYVVKEVGGLKVAIIGVTTPSIPMWEEKANFAGYRFEPIVSALQKTVAEVRAKHQPAVVVVAAHSGLGHDLRTGAAESGDLPGENAMYEAAMQVKGIDAIIFGHTHSQLASATVNGVLLMQPKNWAMSLGAMDFTLTDEGGAWKVESKASRLIPVTAAVAADPRILEMGAPYQEAAEQYLNTPVATSKAELTSAMARVEDTAILDAIQRVQMAEAKADVSFASSFNPRVHVPAGQVTVRQIAALYIYDNTLLAIEGNGKMVREALENAARYYLPCPGDCSTGPLINTKMPGFNYDIAQGVEYEIDISKPVGQRIQNLRWHGKPLADDQKLRIAVNNYRAGGSGGYTMFQNAKVLWKSSEEIRDMIIRYYTREKQLPDAADGNWRVLPEAAAKELEREATAEARRSFNQ